ncbi:unnamed protein product [Absidia cylindrospora]
MNTSATPNDALYHDYFTAAELDEIRTYHASPLPPVPDNIDQFLTALKRLSMHAVPLPYVNAILGATTTILRFDQLTEFDLIMRPFHFVLSAFNASNVNARSQDSQHVDIRFRADLVEVGCMTVNDDDILQQAKALKTMLCTMAAATTRE